MDSELAARVQWLEDRFENMDRVATYCNVIDDSNMAALRELWVDDATFGSVSGSRTTGADEIVEYIGRRAAIEDWSFHYPHAHIIERIGPDEARGVVTKHAEMSVDEKRCVVAAMRYSDKYQRQDGKWKFKERIISFLYSMDLQTLATGFDNRARMQWPRVGPADFPESLDTWKELHTSGEEG